MRVLPSVGQRVKSSFCRAACSALAAYHPALTSLAASAGKPRLFLLEGSLGMAVICSPSCAAFKRPQCSSRILSKCCFSAGQEFAGFLNYGP